MIARAILIFGCLLAAAHPLRAKDPVTPTENRTLPALAGMSLGANEDGLRVHRVLPNSAAEKLGITRGDALLYINGKTIKKIHDADQAIANWPPATRLSAVVRRGMSILRLETKAHSPQPPAPRSPSALSRREEGLRDEHLKRSRTAGSVPKIQRPGFTVSEGEKIWIRFPQGIPQDVTTGDILEGETSTSLSTDADLDFLAIPQNSRVWAHVVAVGEDGDELVRTARLHIYKIELKGGRAYRCSAIPIKASGRKRFLRVSDGGTIISANTHTDAPLAPPERNFQIRFIAPLTLYEPSSFYQAGPGIWLKSSHINGKKRFIITHIISQRSAQQAGLVRGDRVYRINGTPVNRLSFPEAIQHLYGEPGTYVTLDIERKDSGKSQKFRLTRGIHYRKGIGLEARSKKGHIVVTKIYPDSPAENAGIQVGDFLIQAGEKKLAELGDRAWYKMIHQDLVGKNALIVQPPGRAMRTIEIQSGRFPVEMKFRPKPKKVSITSSKKRTTLKKKITLKKKKALRPRRGGRRKQKDRSRP